MRYQLMLWLALSGCAVGSHPEPDCGPVAARVYDPAMPGWIQDAGVVEAGCDGGCEPRACTPDACPWLRDR